MNKSCTYFSSKYVLRRSSRISCSDEYLKVARLFSQSFFIRTKITKDKVNSMKFIFIRFLKLRRFWIIFFSIVLFGYPFILSLLYQQSITSDARTTFIISNVTSYRQFCRELTRRIEREVPPTKTSRLRPGLKSIPYAYSEWQSTPLMPRVLTPCEHAVYMRLLSILVERVFKKYNIPYMMMAATLLGIFLFVRFSMSISIDFSSFQVVILVMIFCHGTTTSIYALEFLIVNVFNRLFVMNFHLHRIRLFLCKCSMKEIMIKSSFLGLLLLEAHHGVFHSSIFSIMIKIQHMSGY